MIKRSILKEITATHNVYGPKKNKKTKKHYPIIHKAKIDDAEILLYQEMQTYVL